MSDTFGGQELWTVVTKNNRCPYGYFAHLVDAVACQNKKHPKWVEFPGITYCNKDDCPIKHENGGS